MNAPVNGTAHNVADGFRTPGEALEVDVGSIRYHCKDLGAPAQAKLMIAAGVQNLPDGGELQLTPDVLALALALALTGWQWVTPKPAPEDGAPEGFDPMTDGLPPFNPADPVGNVDGLNQEAFLTVGKAIVNAAFVTPDQAGNSG